MLHSFAHALMRQLSLACGYSSSALRERLYVGDAPTRQMGVLIHTDSPDSEGTLGGLVRQGTPDRLRDTLVGMLRDARWCSSDPVCITGTMTLSTPRNGAACHACLLAPETSCEHFNTLLDRALLVGTPDARRAWGSSAPARREPDEGRRPLPGARLAPRAGGGRRALFAAGDAPVAAGWGACGMPPTGVATEPAVTVLEALRAVEIAPPGAASAATSRG